MNDTASHLKLSAVGKHYGKLKVVDSVSFEVPAREFVVLLGPSGCGKSTLLRMIAGLETISTGDLLIDGKSVTNTHPRDRDIAMVFQNYALYPHMSVFANLEYPLKLRGVDQSARQARVREVAALLELDQLLERKPAQLSGGQRQRVAMGRAIVRRPALFLMDEPLSNLDARLRMQMRVDIAALQKRLGVTTIYVTHDQVEAMTMADRIVVMSQGRVQQIGKPYEVYQRPANLFVAGFMGAPPMNMIDARSVPALLPSGANPARTIVGIRPEDIVIGQDATAGLGEVEAVEALGADSLVYLLVAGIAVAAESDRPAGGAARIVVRLGGNAAHLRGGSVGLSFPKAALHFFDKSTGERLPDAGD